MHRLKGLLGIFLSVCLMPHAAASDSWTWIDIPGSRCRNGETAGIFVNNHAPSNKVLVHLEGGWACFNRESCARHNGSKPNPKAFPGGALWDRNNPSNPFADFNYVSVPNCSGDFHSGNRSDVNVPGVGVQQFQGYANLDLYLDRILATMPQIDQLVLAGTSAGGIGVFYNASHFARRLAGKNLVILDSCGHPVRQAAFPACLQMQLRDLWGHSHTVLADCGKACGNGEDTAFASVLEFLNGPQRAAGFLGAIGDDADRWVYGWGADQCRATTPSIPVDIFRREVLNLRQEGNARSAPLSTFYTGGEGHECLLGQWDKKLGSTTLESWVRDVLAGQRVHAGP